METTITRLRLVENKFRKLFAKLAFRGYPKIIIASTGRSGSSMLLDAVTDSLIKHRFHTKRGTRISNLIKSIIAGYIDRIEKLSEEPFLVYKTHDIYEGNPDSNCKFIFIYGDPLESALSVQQTVEQEGQQWFLDHQFHLRACGDYADLFQKDVLAYRTQLESWLTQRNANIVCIDFDDLWVKTEELSNFLGFEVELPTKRPRREKSNKDNINESLFNLLRDVRSRLRKEYESNAEFGSDTATSPRLSIILATWQAASTLERCLQSMLEQDFTDWELLIADGASTDGTVDLIRKYEQHIAWWNSESDGGIYDAWNQALGHARGEYVCFIGADDSWADSGALARIFTAIGDDAYDMVSSRGLFFDSDTGKSFTFGSAWDYQRIGPRMIVCHPGLLHRRSLFQSYGLFDTHYRITGDLDFLLRLPRDLRTLHVDSTSVAVEMAGVSRRNVRARLLEQREVLSRCERYGPLRAHLTWIGKLIRMPIARLLNLSY